MYIALGRHLALRRSAMCRDESDTINRGVTIRYERDIDAAHTSRSSGAKKNIATGIWSIYYVESATASHHRALLE